MTEDRVVLVTAVTCKTSATSITYPLYNMVGVGWSLLLTPSMLYCRPKWSDESNIIDNWIELYYMYAILVTLVL